MKIQVRPKHIREGEKESAESCPIALAIRARQFQDVWVERVDVMAYHPHTQKDVYWSLPPVAQAFLGRFDEGRPVKPFTFEMKRVSE